MAGLLLVCLAVFGWDRGIGAMARLLLVLGGVYGVVCLW